MKKILCLVLLAALLLTGCQGGVDMEQADQEVAAFFEAAAKQDFTAAQQYLHPQNSMDLQKYFGQLNGLDSGAAVKNVVNVSWSWYDSTVDGSQYTREYMLTSGETTFHATVQIVRNDAGYGIYSLNIEPADT